MNTKSRRGYTLISVLIAVIIIGILSVLTMPAIRGLRDMTTDRDAIGRAAALNQAQQAYKWRVANASSSWTAATTDDGKFQLIRDYLPLKDSYTTLVSFQPVGYTFSFGSTVDTLVTITGPRGSVSY